MDASTLPSTALSTASLPAPRVAGISPHALTGKLKGPAMSAEKIDKVAHEFEAMFLGQMLKPMFETVQTDTMFGGGEGEGYYRDMMVQEYAKEISKRGGIGIADSIKSQLLQMQEAR
jgi:peptidoglycan hydrolase FlgJ